MKKKCKSSTKRQNELFSEVRKLFSQSCTDVPAQLPSAMLPRQARGTCKELSSKPQKQFIFSLGMFLPHCILSCIGKKQH